MHGVNNLRERATGFGQWSIESAMATDAKAVRGDTCSID